VRAIVSGEVREVEEKRSETNGKLYRTAYIGNGRYVEGVGLADEVPSPKEGEKVAYECVVTARAGRSGPYLNSFAVQQFDAGKLQAAVTSVPAPRPHSVPA
jgi:hypothetical protein